jgi:hypothetical protein
MGISKKHCYVQSFDSKVVYLPLPTTNGPCWDLNHKCAAIPVYDMHQYLPYLFTVATIGAGPGREPLEAFYMRYIAVLVDYATS